VNRLSDAAFPNDYSRPGRFCLGVHSICSPAVSSCRNPLELKEHNSLSNPPQDHTGAFTHLRQLAPNLSSIDIRNGVMLALDSEPLAHVDLQCLYIDMEFYEYPVLVICGCPKAALFKILVLPNLRELQFRRVVLEWPHQEFKACLAQSNCPLECLIFGAGVATDEQRAECIALNPSLEVVVKPFICGYLR